jgi:hypothetical protein
MFLFLFRNPEWMKEDCTIVIRWWLSFVVLLCLCWACYRTRGSDRIEILCNVFVGACLGAPEETNSGRHRWYSNQRKLQGFAGAYHLLNWTAFNSLVNTDLILDCYYFYFLKLKAITFASNSIILYQFYFLVIIEYLLAVLSFFPEILLSVHISEYRVLFRW